MEMNKAQEMSIAALERKAPMGGLAGCREIGEAKEIGKSKQDRGVIPNTMIMQPSVLFVFWQNPLYAVFYLQTDHTAQHALVTHRWNGSLQSAKPI
jgi:hypothetical protein